MNDFKKTMGLVTIVVMALVTLGLGGSLFETNSKTTYQIKQAAMTGTMSARMKPGTYLQLFGDIETWPKAQTFFFTSGMDAEGDTKGDTSIEVRFDDGSLCNVEGTLRIIMPTSPNSALELVTKDGYDNYRSFEAKMIKPIVRNVLRSTANLMSAKDSYSTRRGEFISYARDQIQNGLYETVEKKKQVEDLVTGEVITKSFTEIKTVNGKRLYQQNPLEGKDVTLVNFEIKRFRYEDKVKTQIAKQQEAFMAVQTAKANAAKAQQDELTIKAEGAAAVAKAQFEEKKVSVRQEEIARREKEVATIEAEKKKAVAKLDKESAALEKDAMILRGQGEAKAKELVMKADGQLKIKLDALVQMNKDLSEAFAKRAVPAYYNAGNDGGNPDKDQSQFMSTMNVLMAKQLGVDLTVKK